MNRRKKSAVRRSRRSLRQQRSRTGRVRFGVAKGKFEVLDTLDEHDTEIARLFQGAGE
ncbi:MAG: hypothetical protein JSS56_16810 [Proteobacteria bacterium]|nr:hypothetical protein [Pseudomonadota bacterium]